MPRTGLGETVTSSFPLCRWGRVDLQARARVTTYMLLARLVGEKGRVYVFEVDLENFALLARNVEANDYRNVTLVQKSRLCANWCDPAVCVRSLYRPASTLELGDSRAFIDVDVVSLDDYFAGHEGRVDFIKMDIEGAEANTIQACNHSCAGMQS